MLLLKKTVENDVVFLSVLTMQKQHLKAEIKCKSVKETGFQKSNQVQWGQSQDAL